MMRCQQYVVIKKKNKDSLGPGQGGQHISGWSFLNKGLAGQLCSPDCLAELVFMTGKATPRLLRYTSLVFHSSLFQEG